MANVLVCGPCSRPATCTDPFRSVPIAWHVRGPGHSSSLSIGDHRILSKSKRSHCISQSPPPPPGRALDQRQTQLKALWVLVGAAWAGCTVAADGSAAADCGAQKSFRTPPDCVQTHGHTVEPLRTHSRPPPPPHTHWGAEGCIGHSYYARQGCVVA